MNRREFIRKTATAAPLLSIFPAELSFISRQNARIEKRSLGKTGEMLSIIGFGGIVVMNVSPQEASESVQQAIDAGINYFDVAPSYGDAEIKLGPALEPYRNEVFLSCKTGKRTKDDARKELEQSLKNLRTDHFDLYQLHAVTTLEDVDTILAPQGALQTFLEAREEGKIRFIGFSAHSVEAAFALMEGFDFDTIMFPINMASWHKGNFGPQVLATAQKRGMGIIALKAMAKGKWASEANRDQYPKAWYEPLDDEKEALMGLRFTLSHPITTAIPPGEPELFKLALKLRDEIAPLSQQEIKRIKQTAMNWNPLFSYSG